MRTPKIGGNWDSSLPTVLSFTQNEYGIIMRMTVRVNTIRDIHCELQNVVRDIQKKMFDPCSQGANIPLRGSKHTHENITCINQ